MSAHLIINCPAFLDAGSSNDNHGLKKKAAFLGQNPCAHEFAMLPNIVEVYLNKLCQFRSLETRFGLLEISARA